MIKKEENIFSSIPDNQYTEDAPSIDPSEFEKVVESRRSVRVFSGEPIPQEISRKCLELALLAPNSSNLQPWEFYWVRDEEKKQDLIKACFSQPAAATASEIFVAVGRTGTWSKNSKRMLETFEKNNTPPPPSFINYYKKLTKIAYTVGPFGLIGAFKKILFFFVGFFQPVPREPTSPTEMKVWAAKTTALACQNLMLAFRAYGYDTCPMEGLDSSWVRKILNLPSDAFVVMGISAGKRSPKGIYGPRLRFPSKEFIKEV